VVATVVSAAVVVSGALVAFSSNLDGGDLRFDDITLESKSLERKQFMR
jgi:hypothetical protein